MSSLSDLLNNDLQGFAIVEMIGIYKTDEEGRKTDPLGFFKNPIIAAAFARSQKNVIEKALILTDGTIGFIIDDQAPVKLFDEEQEVVNIKKKALEKLTPEECKLLGLTD